MLDPIRKEDFLYTLPDEKIARFPLPQRDTAKLLVYRQGQIQHSQFRHLGEFLPPDSFLFFNNTKVIAARMAFQRDTGAHVEIFLLNPTEPTPVVALAMQQTGFCVWHCMIGNKKRLKTNEILTKNIQTETGQSLQLRAQLIDLENMLVRFEWSPADISFAQVVEQAGQMPLPPYLKRSEEAADKLRYQTVYAQNEGAVAAPTAGLHFTPAVFEDLQQRGMAHDYVTLHVSAGTFRPLQADNVLEHEMHAEQLIFSVKNLENLLANERIIAVGTTSMRALESLYWFGVKLLKTNDKDFRIDQYLPYQFEAASLPTRAQSLTAVLDFMKENNLEELGGQTQIYIVPSYEFKICKGIVTNYHQPESTLILLVAAFVGENWRKIYDEALNNDYRFLSFGDSSLLLP
ncbi:S-adenosylmethionine:tRNA ribosyltransferase-isomerase [Flexibacter flexilis DSM 6793]|uniref:S-adenosylmethionine:tRNA ribosyltransferase-isomerase n=1 Tax=Flexibacter flexilis DSM 6793 TaxID=927664 RepID=A0A1I1JSJ7_9BACT|nr:S-adenosylmethionine:tRNA ribosyltransferase-isomerase [Flexibacter flexilis]SFC48833.1 S-adenosylmethionine:tRNA ribosyltransferase-isomerase [Flexibacter flexilis DSM 6793]